jgi:hypothetical protein
MKSNQPISGKLLKVFSIIALLLSSIHLTAQQRETTSNKPNVIVINVDELRWDA